jgi:hypothetical protein
MLTLLHVVVLQHNAQVPAAVVLCYVQVPADVQADAETQAKAAQEDSDMED